MVRETGGAHVYWDHYSLVKNWSDTAPTFETKPYSRLRVVTSTGASTGNNTGTSTSTSTGAGTNVSIGVQVVASPSDSCATGSGASWSVEAGATLNLLGGGHLHCGSEVRVESSGVLEVGSSGPASSVTMWGGASAIGNGTVRYTGRYALEPAAHAIYAIVDAPGLRLKLDRGALVRVSPNMSSTAPYSTDSPSSSSSSSASLTLNGLAISTGSTLMLLRSYNGSIPEQSTDESAEADDDEVAYLQPTPVLVAGEIAVRSGGLLVAPSSAWRVNVTNVTVSGTMGSGGQSSNLWCVRGTALHPPPLSSLLSLALPFPSLFKSPTTYVPLSNLPPPWHPNPLPTTHIRTRTAARRLNSGEAVSTLECQHLTVGPLGSIRFRSGEVACGTMHIEHQGSLSCSGLGHASGEGPGRGLTSSSGGGGGGHGGGGGGAGGGGAYGTVGEPTTWGSGGAGTDLNSAYGGAGGGRVDLRATSIWLEGELTCDGGHGGGDADGTAAGGRHHSALGHGGRRPEFDFELDSFVH